MKLHGLTPVVFLVSSALHRAEAHTRLRQGYGVVSAALIISDLTVGILRGGR